VKNKAIDLLLNAETLDSSESIQEVHTDNEESEEEEVEADEEPWDTEKTLDWLCEEVPDLVAHRKTLESIGVDRKFLIESHEEDFIGMGLVDDKLRGDTMRAISKLKHINVKQLDEEEIPEHVENLFKTIDLDGGGYIDEAEFSTALTFLELSLDPSVVSKIYGLIDENNNGQISAPEFSHFLQKPQEDSIIENVRSAILTRLAVTKEKKSVDKDMQRGMSELMDGGFGMGGFGNVGDMPSLDNMEMPKGFANMGDLDFGGIDINKMTSEQMKKYLRE